ncbi:MAG: T9SS type A sorting domain-containing protein [Ignavibacteriaceae bacterium]|nr:T9SS type A sorting domain-containing protein [Ignavibacteriaceae bacterium]
MQSFVENKGLPWADIEGHPRDSNPDIGAFEYDGLLGVEDELHSFTYKLEQNYPNPFNPSTTIMYFIPVSSFVILKVFDILGNEISSLVNEEKSEGNYVVEFDAASLPSGIYFYRLQTANYIETRKMILIK